MKVREVAATYQKISIHQKHNDAAYWRGQPYQARLEALEQIRREYHHWIDNAYPRLQRVYTIVKR
jgi:hypothetical protein